MVPEHHKLRILQKIKTTNTLENTINTVGRSKQQNSCIKSAEYIFMSPVDTLNTTEQK